MEIPIRYNPQEIEDKWYKFWIKKGCFQGQVSLNKRPFCIVIPPPNVTGILHMGHALNNSIQDVLIRFHRMKGYESLWIPGTDHAGIATQNVVEKAIAKEGFKRDDLGRDRFLERVWKWKEQYGYTIIHQLKKLGSSCDWSRIRFTMDESYSRSVREVFVRLWEKGLIYQDDKVINWCPRCQTALSDEEVSHCDLQGNLYYLKYPLKDTPDEFIIVATTRPETMPGDTAVAVNPDDRRYKKFIGKEVILPLINRRIKIIADNMVDTEFGTGAVKVTPAHDPNDYILGKKHNLEFINIMYPDGRLNENTGNYKDMDRFKARDIIVDDLKERNLLQKVQPHKLSVGHCYRCHTVIEPYLSRQWFVKMKPLAKPAIDAVKDGRIKFYPRRWTKVYLNWMENIQDWCISRQIWWGHRIPLWHCLDCNKEVIASVEAPNICSKCNSSNLKQEEDVLDTWFSSWLWPFAAFYWPGLGEGREQKEKNQKELSYFYPTSVLVTAPEIIFFWVARMIMAGFELMEDIPFHDVYIHGTVRDIKGRKMSKSLGNIIDPLDIISEYGSDALRFCLIYSAGQGDLFLSKEKFEMGRNFANKLWNASRFILMNLDRRKINIDLSLFIHSRPENRTLQGADEQWPLSISLQETAGFSPRSFITTENLNLIDRWILSRFYNMLKGINRHLDKYNFNEAANLLYSFLWHEFCDWYLEVVKNRLEELNVQVIMYYVMEKTLRVLHPFMPFITEDIWQRFSHSGEPLMVQAWPEAQHSLIDKDAEIKVELIFDIVKTIRNLRSQINLKPTQTVPISVSLFRKDDEPLISSYAGLISNMCKLDSFTITDSNKKFQQVITDVCKSAQVYLLFQGVIDVESEKQKIKENLLKHNELLSVKKVRIKNSEFIKKAPVEVIEKEKESILEIENTIGRLEKIYNELN